MGEGVLERNRQLWEIFHRNGEHSTKCGLSATSSIRGEEEKRHIDSTLSTVRIAPFQATPEVFWTMLK